MRKYFAKLKAGVESRTQLSSSPKGHGDVGGSQLTEQLTVNSGHTSNNSQASSVQDIFHYRKQRGVNLGSWFVLERWISDTPFQSAHSPAQSDLDVARGTQAKEILEAHWNSWITESDWDWLEQRGINTVRIPIGYYHLCGAEKAVLDGTDFYPFYHVYEGAWNIILKAIFSASQRNMGILFDLHAAPGKQNNDAHAGTSEHANFFNDPHNQRKTIQVLQSLVSNLSSFARSKTPPLQNIVGVELLNEPHPPSDPALQSWYTKAIHSIRQIDREMPIYIGECWRTDAYAKYLSKSPAPGLNVLDHHLYRCFTSSDIHTSAEEHTQALRDTNAPIPLMFRSVSERVGRAGGGIIVGEWSGALNPGSLRGVPDEQKNFVLAQLDLFERHCGGWFFWTYKKESCGDTGWSFRDAVEAGVFPKSVGLSSRVKDIRADETRRLDARRSGKETGLREHITYWSRHPGKYQHWRFADGFERGWNDAYLFFESGLNSRTSVPEIGFKHAWVSRRTSDHGTGYWEFEHGFLQGIEGARKDFVQFYC